MCTYLHRLLGLTLLLLSNQVRSNEDEAAYIIDVAGSYSAYRKLSLSLMKEICA